MMTRRDNRYIAKRGSLAFLIITLIVAAGILGFPIDSGTWDTLAHFRCEYLLGALLLVCLSWYFDALRLKALVAAQGSHISFSKCLKIVLSSVFASAVTPFSTGGGALQIYLLFQERIPIGIGSAIGLIKFSMDLLFFSVCIPAVFLLTPDGPKTPLFALPCLFVVAIYCLLHSPGSIKRAIRAVAMRLGRLRLIRWSWRLEGVLREVDNFHSALVGQWRHRKCFLSLGLTYTAIHIGLRFMVAPVLLAGLGIKPKVLQAFLYQVMLSLGLYFSPTPGGSGAAELGFAALFLTSVPQNLLGVYTILWRFFTNLIAVGLGGLIVIGTLGLRGLRTVRVEPKRVGFNRAVTGPDG